MIPCEAKKSAGEKWGCCMIVYDPMNTNRFLLCKRAPGERQEPGSWGLPGGKVEVGEVVQDAVVRELYEETGLEVGKFKYVGQFVLDGWMDFVFISDAPIGKVQLDPKECEAYKWVTMEELDTEYSGYEKLNVFSFTKEAIAFYKEWKDITIFRELETARKRLMNQYP